MFRGRCFVLWLFRWAAGKMNAGRMVCMRIQQHDGKKRLGTKLGLETWLQSWCDKIKTCWTWLDPNYWQWTYFASKAIAIIPPLENAITPPPPPLLCHSKSRPFLLFLYFLNMVNQTSPKLIRYFWQPDCDISWKLLNFQIFVCVGHTAWAAKGREGLSQEARMASSKKSGPGGPLDF